MKIKNNILNENDIRAIKEARRVFKKIDTKMRKIESERKKLDDGKVKDSGGKKWVKLTTKLYENLDFLYKILHIDASEYPKFVEKIEK